MEGGEGGEGEQRRRGEVLHKEMLHEEVLHKEVLHEEVLHEAHEEGGVPQVEGDAPHETWMRRTRRRRTRRCRRRRGVAGELAGPRPRPSQMRRRRK